MSTVQNVRNPILSGLNFFLDPANPKSIPVIPSTNLMLQSQNFISSSWSKTNVTVTSGVTAPDGTVTANNILNTTSTFLRCQQSFTGLIPGTVYTYSCFIKKENYRYASVLVGNTSEVNNNFVQYDFDLNVVTSSVSLPYRPSNLSSVFIIDGWYRLSFTFSIPSGYGDNVKISGPGAINNYGPSISGNSLNVWGAQLEISPFATPYIPTTTTSASRSAVYDLSNSLNTSNLANGTLYNSSNLGNFFFDATDDFINLTNYFSSTTWSVNYFTKFNISKIKSTQQGFLNRNSVGNSDGRLILELTYSASIGQISIDSNSNIYIGGRIVEYNGTERQFIVKTDSSGTLITQFNLGLSITQTQSVTCIGFNSSGDLLYGGYNLNNLVRVNSTTGALLQTVSTVNASITQSKFIIDSTNDKIYIGGWFTSIQGTAAQRLARLNLSAMTIDTSFNTTTGFVNTEDVQDMVLQPDGKLIVLGQFTSYKGVSINRIVRLNSDASIDPTFQTSGATFGFNGNISRNCTVLLSDGKVVVGGAFTTYSGVTYNRIIRLNSNGTIDNTFTIGTGFNDVVNCVTIQSDGKLLVGGSFTTYSGQSNSSLVRLNSNGTKDTTFTGITNSTVTSITVQNDGKILIGGSSITQVNGTNVNQVCRLNTDGSIDNTFSAGTGILGAYRFNCQINYSSAVSTITQQIFYGYKTATDWRKYEVIGDLLSNKWFNMCVTKSTGNTISVYYDGTLYQSATPSPVFSTNNITNRIGPANGNVGVIQYYNRELSSTEVLNNYRSFKDRYQIT